MKKLSWLILITFVLTTCFLTACNGESDTITVASKDFTEQFILGEMYALLLEDAGYTVERKINLGGTPVAHQALLDGEIDVYPEYTGTGLLTILKHEVMSDPQAVYDVVKEDYASQFNLTWLEPAPMNNTQTLAMKKTRAAELGISTFSQLVAQADQLVLIGPPEFTEREDGMPGMKEVYGDFEFAKFMAVSSGLRYPAIINDEADVVLAFGTDGEIAAYDLIRLQDDKGLYPPYQVAPVIRQEVLDGDAEIANVLNQVAPLLTNETMQSLNNEVSGNGREPADVAKEFLVTQGLIGE
ncbi:MAG: quaternary ammonium transporter [Chloroflexi bacterium]|nr:MAG: quaternary ammonium transporter [Chloroflexota bacterium]PIE80275.1 MAG: quaternary ammonium transporter [Chloroflexota bacterium]